MALDTPGKMDFIVIFNTDLNMAISPLVNNICAVVCPTGTDCTASTYPCSPTVTTAEVPSGCAAPMSYPLNNMRGNFPYYYWYNNSISDSSYVDAVSNATNAFIGMVSTYSNRMSGNPLQGNTSDWLQAGNYFFQLMSYVGGQSTNQASFSVIYSASPHQFSGGNPSSTAWGGIPVNNNTTYLAACTNTGTQTRGVLPILRLCLSPRCNNICKV